MSYGVEKIIFDNRTAKRERFYCRYCFYNTKDKNEKMRKYPKPETKCYIGSRGFYKLIEV
jgi:sulfatase maturation enzyme AslB (radical SAM superfamily)